MHLKTQNYIISIELLLIAVILIFVSYLKFPQFQVLVGLVGSTLIIGGFVPKSAEKLLDIYTKKDIEKFKIEIQSKAQLSIEESKNRLREISTKSIYQSQKIVDKRLEFIEETYKNLVDAHSKIYSLASLWEHAGEPTKEEKASQFIRAINKFRSEFILHSYYLPEDLERRLWEYFNRVLKIYRPVESGLIVRKSEKDPYDWEGIYKASTSLEKEVEVLVVEIRRAIRDLLEIK